MEEFDEEIGGEVHHQHRLLSCLNLSTKVQYSIQNEDPAIYSDSEDDPMPRAWPDLELPKPPAAAEIMPPAIKQQLKEHQKSSAVAVLAQVRRGNTLCSICGHSFNSTQSLRTHIQGQHMDTSHQKCNRCDYSAGDSYSLKLHFKIHDPEGRKFKCDFAGCGRVYNTKGHLNKHQMIHTQGRSLPCPHCGKDFSGMYGLKSHLLSCSSTPGGIPEKCFQCEICNKAYYWQAELTRHQKSKGH